MAENSINIRIDVTILLHFSEAERACQQYVVVIVCERGLFGSGKRSESGILLIVLISQVDAPVCPSEPDTATYVVRP